jgi:KilA-N domain
MPFQDGKPAAWDYSHDGVSPRGDTSVTNLAISSDVITRSLNQVAVGQCTQDGYVNATAICQAANKEWSGYRRNQTTDEFLDALAGSLQICRDLLTQTVTTGMNEQRGTWVHPRVAIHLAMWCSPQFAIQVTGRVEQWYRTCQPPVISHATDPIRIKIENFTAIIQLRQRLGMKVDRNVHLAVEALQGQVVDLPVVTLKARDLHYAEHFWAEKRKEGWRTHYSTRALTELK